MAWYGTGKYAGYDIALGEVATRLVRKCDIDVPLGEDLSN